MQIDRELTCVQGPSAVALGCFDGMHLGHQLVIGQTVRQSGAVATVFTFEEAPQQVKGNAAPRLTSNRQKLRLMEQAGVKQVYMVAFSSVQEMEPEQFVRDVLVRVCHASMVSCGFNFHFGKGGKGDRVQLQELCAAHGIKTVVCPAVELDGSTVSSTRIRNLVEKGEMEQASRLLGRNFSIDFEVVHGRRLGRQMGTPTINQPFPGGFVLPRFGVYASVVEIGETLYFGVTNVGVKPTVGSDRVLAETWIPDYRGKDMYGESPVVELLCFMREEQKFSGVEELRSRILQDEESCRRCFLKWKQKRPEITAK